MAGPIVFDKQGWPTWLQGTGQAGQPGATVAAKPSCLWGGHTQPGRDTLLIQAATSTASTPSGTTPACTRNQARSLNPQGPARPFMSTHTCGQAGALTPPPHTHTHKQCATPHPGAPEVRHGRGSVARPAASAPQKTYPLLPVVSQGAAVSASPPQVRHGHVCVAPFLAQAVLQTTFHTTHTHTQGASPHPPMSGTALYA